MTKENWVKPQIEEEEFKIDEYEDILNDTQIKAEEIEDDILQKMSNEHIRMALE